MPKTILFIDSDDSVLTGLPKKVHKQYVVKQAKSYKEALAILKKTPDCCLLISEIDLDDRDGISFLTQLRKKFPKIIRMVMTARREFDEACKALNSAGAFKIIAKPCPPDMLAKMIKKGVQKYDADREKQRAMRTALLGSVKAMVDIVDMVSPEAMGFAKRIRSLVYKTGKALGYKHLWQLDLAVMLSHIGCVALPDEIIYKMDSGEPLTPEEKQIFGMHPGIASTLLSNINQMAPVAEIIRHQHETLNPKQPLGSRIIKVALDLDRLERLGKDPLTILDKMSTKDKLYDPKVVESMLKLLTPPDFLSVCQVSIEELEEGMIMAKDLVNKDGSKLLLRGQKISKASLIRLKAFHIALGIMDPVHVVVAKSECT